MSDSQRDDAALGGGVASGVLWMAAQKWVARLTGFVTLVVLTRAVSPQGFGVVAAAMAVIPMVYLLADMGFSTYLLQADEIDPRSLSTAFWSSVAAGAVLCFGLLAGAPLVAMMFRTPELTPVLRMLVLAIVPTVLGAVPLALLKRAMAFRVVAIQAAVAAMLAQVVAIAMALLGAGVWALVAQVVVTQWVIALMSWRSTRWVPSMTLSPSLFREMSVFGLRVSSVDLAATGRMWAESWIITVTLGPTALGLLNVGQRLVGVALDLSAAPLIPVSTVVFARLRESAGALRVKYLKALGVAYAVVSPLMILIVVTAPLSVPLLFGEQWTASVQPTQALAVAGIITLGAMLDQGLFYGLGRPGTWLGYALLVDGATVGTTAVAVRWGPTGVAVGFVVVATLATVGRWLLVARQLDLSPRAVARPFLVLALPATVTMLLGVLVLRAVSGLAAPLPALAIAGTATVVTYLVLLRVVAATVIGDALGVMPVPARYAERVERLLRLAPASTR
ncbi:lipopolysaccharide biosynthesis protein [Intrasporangium sp. YIM S08009]|uniref:lipopolysaccharide biosynthesis protein n=1 Tax=Intrasporangium zincisolvens TaxID=3080018 RepID=UPI002B061A0F|nr:lipopolysaccharide biosynthesis protein [Intrasporangium sp. YIM S08009]